MSSACPPRIHEDARINPAMMAGIAERLVDGGPMPKSARSAQHGTKFTAAAGAEKIQAAEIRMRLLWCLAFRRLLDMPMCGGHERLQAHSADDLFESRIVAVCRDQERAHRDLRRIFKVLACQPTKAQSRARRCLEE